MTFVSPLTSRHIARTVLATACAAWLTGCAAPPASTDAPNTPDASGAAAATPSHAAAIPAAPAITTTPTSVGTWVDLGYFLAPWLAGDAPVPVADASAPTRVAGLRREDGQWLAIVLVQSAPAGSAPCPQPNSLHAGKSSDGCLRMRRNADFDRWLEQQHSVLHRWLNGQGWASQPRAWVSSRVPSGSRGALEAHALVHPGLLEPTTRNNTDFLEGGQPGEDWAQRFARATRAAAGGAALAVPAFPFGPHVAPPPPPVVVAPPAPAQATQVAPPPVHEQPAPRRDRE